MNKKVNFRKIKEKKTQILFRKKVKSTYNI